MKTQKEVRQVFWKAFPEFKSDYRARKRQNEYKCEIRVSFCAFVDFLAREKKISEKLAQRVTL